MSTPPNQIRDAVNWAIYNGKCLKITYQDYNGRVTSRVVEPKTWLTGSKFSAFCHLRQDNRTFRIENIVMFEKVVDEPTYSEPLPNVDEYAQDKSKTTANNETTSLISYTDQELERLKCQLRILEDRLANEEVCLASLEAEYYAFQRKYLVAVGSLIAELDLVEAKIAELLFRLHPDQPMAEKQYDDAQERAHASAEEAQRATEIPPHKTTFHPSEDLKTLFREIAKRVHPDFAVSEEDRNFRNELMVEANKAYEEGDEEALRTLLMDSESLKSSDVQDHIELEISRIKRKIAQLDIRLRYVIDRQVKIRLSEMYLLKRKVEEAEMNGEDMLSQMAAQLKKKIRERKIEFEGLWHQWVSN